jgi:hypothetical protein
MLPPLFFISAVPLRAASRELCCPSIRGILRGEGFRKVQEGSGMFGRVQNGSGVVRADAAACLPHETLDNS